MDIKIKEVIIKAVNCEQAVKGHNNCCKEKNFDCKKCPDSPCRANVEYILRAEYVGQKCPIAKYIAQNLPHTFVKIDDTSDTKKLIVETLYSPHEYLRVNKVIHTAIRLHSRKR